MASLLVPRRNVHLHLLAIVLLVAIVAALSIALRGHKPPPGAVHVEGGRAAAPALAYA